MIDPQLLITDGMYPSKRSTLSMITNGIYSYIQLIKYGIKLVSKILRDNFIFDEN